jgi:hypothetical protein
MFTVHGGTLSSDETRKHLFSISLIGIRRPRCILLLRITPEYIYGDFAEPQLMNWVNGKHCLRREPIRRRDPCSRADVALVESNMWPCTSRSQPQRQRPTAHYTRSAKQKNGNVTSQLANTT